MTRRDGHPSLNADERKLTSAELRARTSRPELVWLLRDHLEAAVRARGVEPHAYTCLSERMRAAAAVWFPLHDEAKAGTPGAWGS